MIMRKKFSLSIFIIFVLCLILLSSSTFWAFADSADLITAYPRDNSDLSSFNSVTDSVLEEKKEFSGPTAVKPLKIVLLHGWLGDSERLERLAGCLKSEIMSADIPVEEKFSFKSYENTEDVESWARDIRRRIPSSWDRLVFIAFSMGGKAILKALADEERGSSLRKRTEIVVTINTPYDKLSLSEYEIDVYHLCKVVSWVAEVPDLLEGEVLERFHSGKIGDQGACRSLAYYSSARDAEKVSESGIPLIAFSSAKKKESTACTLGLLDPYQNYADDGMVPLVAQYTSSVTEVVNYGSYCHTDVLDKAAPTLSRLITKKIQEYLAFGDAPEESRDRD